MARSGAIMIAITTGGGATKTATAIIGGTGATITTKTKTNPVTSLMAYEILTIVIGMLIFFVLLGLVMGVL